MFMDYHFLFEIAVILLSTKVLGILTKRFALPQVVGALLAGLLLGPAMLGVLQETTPVSYTHLDSSGTAPPGFRWTPPGR